MEKTQEFPRKSRRGAAGREKCAAITPFQHSICHSLMIHDTTPLSPACIRQPCTSVCFE